MVEQAQAPDTAGRVDRAAAEAVEAPCFHILPHILRPRLQRLYVAADISEQGARAVPAEVWEPVSEQVPDMELWLPLSRVRSLRGLTKPVEKVGL